MVSVLRASVAYFFVPDIQNHRYVDRDGNCISYSGHNATAGSPYFTSGWVVSVVCPTFVSDS